VTGANKHDSPILKELLKYRNKPKRKRKQNICLDKWYFWQPSLDACKENNYIPHIRSRGEEKLDKATKWIPNRRWVIERTNSWINRFRKLLVRYEKKSSSYEALLELACAIITFRKMWIIYG
jgi:putative transposase